MLNRKVVLVASGLVFGLLNIVPNPAFAAGAAEEIAQINEQIAILSAQLAELEVRAKIATKQQEINKTGSGNSNSVVTNVKELPVVRAIEGVDGKLTATLGIGGGASKTVQKGDKIDGWTITKVGVNEVLLVRGKETAKLGFGTEPALPVAATPGQGGVSAPGYPR